MISSITFGNFPLTSSNGVSVNVIREKSAAERAVGILRPARDRGVEVISLTPQGKIIEINGTLSGTANSIATYQLRVRDFAAIFQQEADLTLVGTDGVFKYEDCICLNPQSIFRTEDHFNIDFIPFTLTILAPTGRAISTTLTENSFLNITDSPFSNEIEVGGSLRPDPQITLTLDSTGGVAVTQLGFLNKSTNESLSIATNYKSNDVIFIDGKTKIVTYNSRQKHFAGVIPRLILGTNQFRATVETGSSVHQSQTGSDTARSVYAANHLSQQIVPDGNITVPQIDLLIKRVIGSVVNLASYDDFEDNTKDTDKWTYTESTGTVQETGEVMRMNYIDDGTQDMRADTDGKTDGDPIVGAKFGIQNSGTTSGDNDVWCEITDGTNYIRAVLLTDVSQFQFEWAGTYGTGTKRINANGGTVEIREDGSNILLILNGSTEQTLSGVSIAANSHLNCRARHNSGSTSGTRFMTVDNVEFYTVSSQTSNTDLELEIQTDSGGDPSGTAVASATAVVKQSDVTEDYAIIPVTFTTPPSLSSGVTYHILLKQTGGDVTNHYLIKSNTAGAYTAGEVSISSDSGASWADQTEDLWFKLYDSFPSGFNLDVQYDYFITHHSVA